MSRSCKQVSLRHVLWHFSRDSAVGSVQVRVLQLSGIRAGIGSLRMSKISIGLYKYLDEMHGGMRESAESRHTKGILHALYMIYVYET